MGVISIVLAVSSFVRSFVRSLVRSFARSTELDCAEAAIIPDVGELELLEFLTFCMEVDPAHGPVDLVEADVVEALEAGADDVAHAVVGDQERLFPAHEDVFALVEVRVVEFGVLGLLSEGPEGGEARPVLHVGSVRGAPFFVVSAEGVFGADDLAFEVSCQGGVILGEAFDTQVATQKRSAHVHVFQLNLNLVVLAVRLLGANELAARS